MIPHSLAIFIIPKKSPILQQQIPSTKKTLKNVNTTLNIKRLQQLQIAGETQQVITELLAYANTIQHRKTRQEIRHLATRWSDYQREERMGTASREELRLSKRQFDKSLLQLLDDLEIGEGQIPYWIPNPFRYMVIAAGILLVSLLAWQQFGSSPVQEIEEDNGEYAGRSNLADTVEYPTQVEDSLAEQSTKKKPSPPTATTPQRKQQTQNKPKESPTTSPKTTELPNPNTQHLNPKSQTPTPLKIQSKTNKGSQDLQFTRGELLRLYTKVNKSCTIRIIYQLADERLVLLENDRHITTAEVNTWKELGDGFTIDAPYGAEKLYLFAQNTDFPTLITENSDGYTFIKEGLPEALQKSRGLKKRQAFAESTLSIITKK